VDADDVMKMIDGLVATLARKFLELDVSLPLPRMTYDEAMERYGCDAPDLRFDLSLVDCTDLAAACEFRVFQSNSGEGRRVRGINARSAADRYSRKGIDELTEFVRQDFGAQGLAWFKVDADHQLVSPIAKNFTASMLGQFAERFQARAGDLLLLVADTVDVTSRALAALRRRLGAELQLVEPGQMHFSWVVEFPMFEYDEAEKRWTAMHHPFTAPRAADLPRLQSDPGACRAQAYDLVINGSEAGGGTVRNHDSDLQRQVFQVLGINEIMAQQRFGFLLDALQYGAPPHAGIALGIDRLVMLFGMLDNIRDCIAFPKTQRAADLMTQAPGPVDAQQLRELRIRIQQG